MDDDFGDLYGDVEVQAASAIDSFSNGHSFAATPIGNAGAESDSEDDDLNIVLNDEEGSIRTDTRSRGVDFDASKEKGIDYEVDMVGRNGSGGFDPVVCENGAKAGGSNSGFPVFKRGRPYTGFFPGNVNAERLFGLVPFSSNSGYWGDKELHRRGQSYPVGCSAASYYGGFSLPRSRTILDVNIDAFEKKRWRSPGADVSDFFNFGFNEDTWKEYCFSLDQFRQQSYTCRHSSIPVHNSSKLPQACECSSRQERTAQEDTARDAILAGSMGSSREEKQHVLSKGQPIQVEESTFERQPTMALSQPNISDSDVIIQINVLDCDENCYGLFKEFDHLERTELKPLEGKGVDVDHDKDGNKVAFPELDGESLDRKYHSHDEDSRSDANECRPHKVKDGISMDGSEAVGTVEKTGEEAVVNMHDPSQDLIETDSSISGKINFSPTVSCSGNGSESLIDGFCNIPEESSCYPRTITTQANLQESVASDCDSPKSLIAIRESSRGRGHASDENSMQDQLKHQNDRVRRRIFADIHDDAFPKSMHRAMSSVHCYKWNEELQASNNHCNEYLSHRMQRDDYYDYGRQGLSSKHCDIICANYPHRKHHRRFEDEMKLCGCGDLDEEISDGRRCRLKNQDDRDRYWYDGEGRHEHACSRLLAVESDRFKARDIQLKKSYGSQLVQDGNSPSSDHEILDNVGEENYRRFIRSRYGGDFVAGSWCMEMEAEYEVKDPHYLTSWSPVESDTSCKQRWQGRLTPRRDMRESQLSSGFSDHRRRIGEIIGRRRGQLGVSHDVSNTEDGIVYPDERGPLWRRKFGHQLQTRFDLHDELVMKWPDGVCSFEKESSNGTKSLRHQRFYASRYANEDVVSNEHHFAHSEGKKIRGQISNKCVNMYGNSMYRCHHDHTIRRSNDPDELIVGKRKAWKFEDKKRPDISRRDGIQADVQVTKDKNKGKRKWVDKFQDAEFNNVSDIEEGEIVTEDLNIDESFKKKFVPVCPASLQEADRALPGKKTTACEGTDCAYDDQRILEAMAKMERRKERFKEPIAASKAEKRLQIRR